MRDSFGAQEKRFSETLSGDRATALELQRQELAEPLAEALRARDAATDKINQNLRDAPTSDEWDALDRQYWILATLVEELENELASLRGTPSRVEDTN